VEVQGARRVYSQRRDLEVVLTLAGDAAETDPANVPAGLNEFRSSPTGSGRIDPGMHGELGDVLARPLGDYLGNPCADIDFASLPAATRRVIRRRRLNLRPACRADVRDDLRL
jgi:hypothetical protein